MQNIHVVYFKIKIYLEQTDFNFFIYKVFQLANLTQTSWSDNIKHLTEYIRFQFLIESNRITSKFTVIINSHFQFTFGSDEY